MGAYRQTRSEPSETLTLRRSAATVEFQLPTMLGCKHRSGNGLEPSRRKAAKTEWPTPDMNEACARGTTSALIDVSHSILATARPDPSCSQASILPRRRQFLLSRTDRLHLCPAPIRDR